MISLLLPFHYFPVYLHQVGGLARQCGGDLFHVDVVPAFEGRLADPMLFRMMGRTKRYRPFIAGLQTDAAIGSIADMRGFN